MSVICVTGKGVKAPDLNADGHTASRYLTLLLVGQPLRRTLSLQLHEPLRQRQRRSVSLGSPECADVAVVIGFSLVELGGEDGEDISCCDIQRETLGHSAAGLLSIIAMAGTRNHVDPYHYFLLFTYFARESLSSNI
jgi:hypothetical protein